MGMELARAFRIEWNLEEAFAVGVERLGNALSSSHGMVVDGE